MKRGSSYSADAVFASSVWVCGFERNKSKVNRSRNMFGTTGNVYLCSRMILRL